MYQSFKQKNAQLYLKQTDATETPTESRNTRGRGITTHSFSLNAFALFLFIGVFLLQLLMPVALLAKGLNIPKPDADYISDQVGIVGEKSRKELKRLNQGLKPTGAQIVVTVIPSLGERDIESVANETFRDWGIGDAEKNNGLLLLISFNDKRFRIEVGRGLEGAIPDGRAGDVLRQDLTPAFKEGQYDEGIYKAIRTLAGLTIEEYGGEFEDLDLQRPDYLNEDDLSLGDLFMFITLLIIFFIVRYKMRRQGYRHSVYYIPRGPGSGGGSFGGGGGFSGGGGSSGGGGASGGW